MFESTRKLAAIMFTDIAGFTALSAKHEEKALELIDLQREVLKPIVLEYNGSWLKEIGDGLLISFLSSKTAVNCAIKIQQTVKETEHLNLRIGIHQGDILEKEGDIFGDDVNIASRIEPFAAVGGVAISDKVERDIASSPELITKFIGEPKLQGVRQQVRVFCIISHGLPETDMSSVEAKLEKKDVKHNLPLQLTSFVGRECEMAELRELISNNRLVTLTGFGGCGKTRLSLQIAADLVEDYPDGVWFVEFAPIADSRLVPDVVARVLQVKEEPDSPLLQTISSYLKDKRLLLLLDNCEHCMEACSELTHELLQSSPELRILATSREGLKTPGEVTWTVPSLTLPDPENIPELQQLERFEAVKLFITRAVAIQSKFALSTRNAPAVAQICHTLDGIPLAIELAAVRIKLFSPADILERLENRFQLLTGGMRTRLEQHKTLRATVDWSYDLLSDPEQTLFNRLSVFAGDFDMEAVEGVCVGESLADKDILELFSLLVDKSLIVTSTQADGSVRYRLLETLRKYSQEKLKESGEEELARASHFRYYLKLADQAYDEQFDETLKWLNRLEMEYENLLAALDWSSFQSKNLIQLAGALGWFWNMHDHFASALHYLKAALNKREGQTPAVARLLSGFGFIGFSIPAIFNDALEALEESVKIWRELGNEKETGLALVSIALSKCVMDDSSYALRCVEESIEIFEKLGDPRLIVRAKTILCWIYIHQFLPDRAEPMAKELLVEALKFQMPLEIALTRHIFADCPLLRGDYHDAQVRYSEALSAALEMGSITTACTEMHGMAMAYAGQSRYHKALRLDGAVLATYEEYRFSVPFLRFWDESLAKTVGRAKEQVGEKEATTLEEEGRAMGFEKAVEYALDFERD
jgi:predicted ATPase/class 3 adenylate cyclase